MLNRLFATLLIRPGEGAQVGYFFALFVTIGVGMALGRGTTDALFFKRYGIEYLPVMYVLVSVLLMGVSLIYAAFVDLIPSERFFRILLGTLAGLLALNWAAITFGGSDLVYPAYFLLYEVASELLLIHGALYLGQNLVQTQSKRLVPVILAGHTIGVIAGGLFLAFASKALGVQNVLLIWAALLGTSFALLTLWHRRRGVSPYFRAPRKERSRLRQSVTQVRQGVRLLGASPLLKWASVGLFFMVISVYVLSYSVNRVYTHSFETEESLSAFFGMLTAVTSTIALLLQIFVTNRVIRRFGVRSVNLFFPATSLLSFTALLASFSLPSAILGSFNKDALMPAFRNPVHNVFMAALPGQLQGRARAMSLVIVMPLALLVAGLFLWAAQPLDSTRYLALIGMIAAAGFLFFSHRMNAAYIREIVQNLRERLFLPEQQMRDLARSGDEQAVRDIERGVMHDNDEISLAYARVLLRSAPERATEVLPRRLETAGRATRDQFIRMLRPLESTDLRDRLRAHLGSEDVRLDATLLFALFEVCDPQAQARVPGLLERHEPRLRAAGIYGALRYPVPELEQAALDAWLELLRDPSPQRSLAGVELLLPDLQGFHHREPLHGGSRDALMRLLACEDTRFMRAALEALRIRPAGLDATPFTEPLLSLHAHPDPAIREACLRCIHLLPPVSRPQLLVAGVQDAHPRVRVTAVRVMAEPHRDPVDFLCRCLTGQDMGSPRAQDAMITRLMEIGAPPDVMLEVSLAKAADAHRMRGAQATLRRAAPGLAGGLRLLDYVLEERTHQFIDLALLALQSSADDQGIAALRAGLQSKDPRQFAGACELLANISHQGLARSLLSLLENDGDGSGDPFTFDSLEALFEWGLERTDPWLRECVTHCARAARPGAGRPMAVL